MFEGAVNPLDRKKEFYDISEYCLIEIWIVCGN